MCTLNLTVMDIDLKIVSFDQLFIFRFNNSTNVTKSISWNKTFNINAQAN